MSHELAITLPYFDVHSAELGPTSPLRFMPRGNDQRFAGIGIEKSMLLPVKMV